MYDKTLSPREATIDFLRKVHAKDPGSMPGTTTSLGCSSYWRSRENPLGFRHGMKGQYLLPICAQTGFSLEKPIELAEAQDVYAWVSHELLAGVVHKNWKNLRGHFFYFSILTLPDVSRINPLTFSRPAILVRDGVKWATFPYPGQIIARWLPQ